MSFTELILGPPIAEGFLISAPYMVMRLGGYWWWLVKNPNLENSLFWQRYYEIKPAGYWVPSPFVITVQFCWVAALFIINLAIGGRIFERII